MTNDIKTVNVEFSHTVRDNNDVDINLAEYREWLDIEPDEDFEWVEKDIIEFLKAGPDYDFNITSRFLDEFTIEQVNFERDC